MASSPEAAANNGQPIALKRRISDPASTNDFTGFVTQKKKLFIGRNGHDQEQSFIPSCQLDNYWKKSGRIQEICKSYSPNVLVPSRQAVRETYLRVFSTLVFAGWLPLFPDFLEVGLTDEQFPTNSLPAIWTDSPIHQQMFEDFKKYQWTFFPVILDSNKLVNTAVPPERILPISNRLLIRESDATLISKVEFHRSCIKPHHDVTSQADNNTTSTYIIKSYKGERYRPQYLDEFHAYNALEGNKPAHVVTCYGAFRHGDTLSLILQWVPGCNLNEFLERLKPPQCSQDLSDFWTSLVKTLIGLHHLHQVMQGDDYVGYRLVHQDIKLDNILLEFDPDSGQRHDGLYKFTPYIADLGNSHVAHLNAQNMAPPAVDRRGNQLYCAPEATRDAGSTWAGTSYLTWEADIFSMGAVMSDVATWVVLGQEGRNLYHQQRLEETNNLPGFRESGYEGTFHNGAEALNCVRAMHERIRHNLPPWDQITDRVLGVIESQMLTPRRPPAKNLFFMLNTELQKDHMQEYPNAQETRPSPVSATGTSDSNPRLDSTVRSTPTPPVPRLIHSPDIGGSVPRFCTSPEITHDSRASSPMTPSSNPTSPVFQIESGYGHHTPSTDGVDPSSFGLVPIPPKPTRPASTPVFTTALRPPAEITRASSTSADYTPKSWSPSNVHISMADCLKYLQARKQKQPIAPSMELFLSQLRTNLGRRDHIFLIDDTASMSKHSDHIIDAFGVLGYIAKDLDPDDLELVFASKPHSVHKKRHTTPLVEILKSHKYSAFTGSIETSLGDVINRLIIPRLPRRVPGFGRLLGPGLHPKPVTLFVLTDGKWGQGVNLGNGLDVPISLLMDKIQTRGLNRTQVMIQFLRFGDDEDGLAHLRFLDAFGRDKGCDIVDMRDITDDVSSMFHASYTQAGDDDHISGTSTPRSQTQSPVVGFPVQI